MDEKLAVVSQYDNAEMAHLDKTALEDAGIQAVIENENLAGAGLYYAAMQCEVKLLVRQSELEQARQVLREIGNSGPTMDGDEN